MDSAPAVAPIIVLVGTASPVRPVPVGRRGPVRRHGRDGRSDGPLPCAHRRHSVEKLATGVVDKQVGDVDARGRAQGPGTLARFGQGRESPTPELLRHDALPFPLAGGRGHIFPRQNNDEMFRADEHSAKSVDTVRRPAPDVDGETVPDVVEMPGQPGRPRLIGGHAGEHEIQPAIPRVAM